MEQDRIPGQTRARGTKERGGAGMAGGTDPSPAPLTLPARREREGSGAGATTRVSGREGKEIKKTGIKNTEYRRRGREDRDRQQQQQSPAGSGPRHGGGSAPRATFSETRGQRDRRERRGDTVLFFFVNARTEGEGTGRAHTPFESQTGRHGRRACGSRARPAPAARGVRGRWAPPPAQKGRRRRRRLGETISRGVDGSRGGGGRLPLARHHHDADGSLAVHGGPPLKDDGVVCVGGREGRGGTKR